MREASHHRPPITLAFLELSERQEKAARIMVAVGGRSAKQAAGKGLADGVAPLTTFDED